MSSPDIVWRVGLSSPCETVFDLFATDRGRERFWAERSERCDNGFHLSFAMGIESFVELLEARRAQLFRVRYFGADTTFALAARADGGCDLAVTARGVPDDDWDDVYAGWVSVLLILKAAVDHGVDLRLHDSNRSWRQRFVDQ